MARRSDVPKFGLLSNIKVLHNAISVAGPFTAQLYAEYGADVIWIENPKAPCITRNVHGHTCEQERRNQRTIALDIMTEEGKEILIKLIKESDVFITAARGGQYDRMGLSNEVLWQHNPKLIIVHISGFGQTGIPEYVKRSSYDPIAQAFAGYMKVNGFPDKPSAPSFPYTADYFTSLFAFGTSVAALYNRERTGKGEAIDLSQFEALTKVQARHPMDYLMLGQQVPKEGSHSTTYAGFGTYRCKDGEEIYIVMLGGGIIKNAVKLLGFDEEKAKGKSAMLLKDPVGQEFEQAMLEFCAARTADQVEKEMLAAALPCSKIMSYKDMAENEHYKAREVFVEWDKVDGTKIKGVNIIPKFANAETKIWRGAPTIGMDTEDILLDAGYTPEGIKELFEKGVVAKK